MTDCAGYQCAQSASVIEMLAAIQDKIGPRKFNAWFRNGTAVDIRDDRVKVAAPNSFVANWIETHYQDEIAAAALEKTGKSMSVVVFVDPDLIGRAGRTQRNEQARLVAQSAEGGGRPRQATSHSNLRHNLRDFVVGEGNKLAHSAAMAVASGKAPFNPLFIHGSCGVGKTHLLQGICNSFAGLRREGRPAAWRYVTAEQFTNEFITSVRRRGAGEFRGRYRGLDLLAIDDVHFLAAKKATQEEFLHTFNAMESAGKSIVMASDGHPRMVSDLNEQLISRFVAGMVVRVEPPDSATRVEIMRRKAASMRLDVPPEILQYVAAHIKGSVRELEGTLIKMAALSALAGGGITMSLASEALAEHLARCGSATAMDDIESATAAMFGVTPADLHSSRRTRTVSVARMIAMFLARRYTRMSYPEIARFMGKNHSSAVLAVQKMERLLAEDVPIEWMTPAGDKSMPASKLVEMLTGQFK